MSGETWTRKYAPKSGKDVMQGAYLTLKEYVLGYRKQRAKAAILQGPTGCGKTSSVYALANELGYEVLELNASDFRNEDAIESIAGSASKQLSIFGRGKIILIDEIDGVSGQQDRGGMGAILLIAEKSSFPVIMTANDLSDKKFQALRRKSLLILYEALTYQQVYAELKNICECESITHDEQTLKKLALRAKGDLRGAINDLQALSQATRSISSQDVDELSDRDREASITEALLKIVKGTDIKVAASAFENVGEELDKCAMWIDENLPYEYLHGKELKKAYDSLSRADVFTGRIRRWQHWRFLVYINALISAGVAISKRERNRSVVQYKQPSRPLKIYIANSKYAKKHSIADKIAEKTKCSSRTAMHGYLPYMKLIFANSIEAADAISEELELSYDEKEWLRR
ncbi:replication factor C large subunit [Candidatus Woesearchaeota archaeon]|nr:replication factor C large subunit [Candidatus Woesearchaeota archaeon]